MKTKQMCWLGCGCVAALLVGGCASPRDAAVAGAWLGRQVGTPLGVAATVVDETFAYAGDIVDANPRYDRSGSQANACPAPATSPADKKSYMVRAEVLIETDAPVGIHSVTLEDPKAVQDFWAVQ